MNILLTSAGRRSYMVDYFKSALQGEGLLYAANSVDCPAFKRADGSFLTPLIYSGDYIPFLLKKCAELKIDLIVPLFDIDMPVLAARRADFEAAGVKLAVSGQNMLKLCSDKYALYQWFLGGGAESFRVPRTFTDEAEALRNQHFPMIVKPRFGMGSIGLFLAGNADELKASCSMCRGKVAGSYLKYESAEDPGRTVIMEERIRGLEYGLDVICDLNGRYVNTIVRKKCAMRSGETDEAVIMGEEDPGYAALVRAGRELAERLHPVGLTDVDVLMGDDMIPYVIDINARFGGGYPFSHLAGADVPRAYVEWMKGAGERADRYCFARPGVRGYKDICPMIW